MQTHAGGSEHFVRSCQLRSKPGSRPSPDHLPSHIEHAAEFIEMTGRTLFRCTDNLSEMLDGEPTPHGNTLSGITNESIVRINRQGDIEVRRPDGWELVGGLLGEFEQKVREITGFNWATTHATAGDDD